VVDNPWAGSGDSASEAECAANLDGGGGGCGEEVRGPVEEAMQVEEERSGVAELSVRVQAVVRPP
jgi:hypothetical protein